MSRRRLFAPLAAIGIGLACMVPGGLVGAQVPAPDVNVHLFTCTVTGTADSVVISDSATPPDTLRDCAAGWTASPTSILIDGQGPYGYTSTDAYFLVAEDGTHTAEVSGMSDPFTFSTAGEPVDLYAYYAVHEVPATEEPTLTPTSAAGPTETVEPTQTPVVSPTVAPTETVAPTAPVSGGVQIHVLDCQVATGATSWIGYMDDGADGFSGCSAADLNAREWGLRVDGARPDSFSGNVAVWTNLADGTHTATTGQGASFEFTVTDGVAELQAYYGPSNGSAPVTSLPNTGTGFGTETGVGIALAALTASAVAGTAGLALRRRR